MRSRLHVVLAYFGIVEDPELEARWEAEPIRGWRAAAVGTAFVLLACLVLGVVALIVTVV